MAREDTRPTGGGEEMPVCRPGCPHPAQLMNRRVRARGLHSHTLAPPARRGDCICGAIALQMQCWGLGG